MMGRGELSHRWEGGEMGEVVGVSCGWAGHYPNVLEVLNHYRMIQDL